MKKYIFFFLFNYIITTDVLEELQNANELTEEILMVNLGDENKQDLSPPKNNFLFIIMVSVGTFIFLSMISIGIYQLYLYLKKNQPTEIQKEDYKVPLISTNTHFIQQLKQNCNNRFSSTDEISNNLYKVLSIYNIFHTSLGLLYILEEIDFADLYKNMDKNKLEFFMELNRFILRNLDVNLVYFSELPENKNNEIIQNFIQKYNNNQFFFSKKGSDNKIYTISEMIKIKRLFQQKQFIEINIRDFDQDKKEILKILSIEKPLDISWIQENDSKLNKTNLLKEYLDNLTNKIISIKNQEDDNSNEDNNDEISTERVCKNIETDLKKIIKGIINYLSQKDTNENIESEFIPTNIKNFISINKYNLQEVKDNEGICCNILINILNDIYTSIISFYENKSNFLENKIIFEQLLLLKKSLNDEPFSYTSSVDDSENQEE